MTDRPPEGPEGDPPPTIWDTITHRAAAVRLWVILLGGLLLFATAFSAGSFDWRSGLLGAAIVVACVVMLWLGRRG